VSILFGAVLGGYRNIPRNRIAISHGCGRVISRLLNGYDYVINNRNYRSGKTRRNSDRAPAGPGGGAAGLFWPMSDFGQKPPLA
jgi:hypothetical protein